VEQPLLAGQVISGRFRLERLLGHGGMGTVWEARHLSLETQIAIKFLNADLSRRRDVLARFSREATSAARIRSPHVVSILDSGFTDDGRGFIAMELLHGEDLGKRLNRFGRLGVSETAQVVTQICRGLSKAHSVGVVHRDLKPENIFVVEEEESFTIKILDFGIAKSIGSEAATHKTDTGQILGTPLYMSPEQALGRPIDSRSDLYSLAVVAYRCLTGRPPFMCPAVGEMIVAVSTQQPPPPSRFDGALPTAIDDWFLRALAKEPSARYQRANDLAESFSLACGEARSSGPPAHDSPRITPDRTIRTSTLYDRPDHVLPSHEEVATTIEAAQLSSGRPRSFRLRWAAVAVSTLLAAGIGTTAFLTHRARSLPPAPVVSALNAAQPAAPVPPLTTTHESPAAPGSGAMASQPPASAPKATITRPQKGPSPVNSVVVSETISAAPAETASAALKEPESPQPVASSKPSGLTIDRGSPW